MVKRLGVDLGTTSIKVCIVDNESIVESVSIEHKADVTPMLNNNECSHMFQEQYPKIIIQRLNECFMSLKETLEDVSEMSVCGQMHGVLLWKPKWTNIDVIKGGNVMEIYEHSVDVITNLITWQDARCDEKFISCLPNSQSNCNVFSGYGCASLIWLEQNNFDINQFTMCGTVMDFLVWLLTQTDCVQMTSHNANSWGYFDMMKDCWEMEM